MSAEGSPTTFTGGPLDGIVVADLSRVLSGPLAAMTLGDLGARVIKVERPNAGDDTRAWGPPFVEGQHSTESTYFLSVNRNKESIELDFGSPEDLVVLKQLIKRSDILIENFRPHVLSRVGLSPTDLMTLNPRLIVLSLSGFGRVGADADRPGYDQIIQGEAGLMSLTGFPDGPPTKVGVPIADIQAGMFGAMGVLAALHEREQTGRGQIINTSLFSALIATHTFQGTRWLVGRDVPHATGNMHPTVAPYGAYPASDGHFQIAVGNDATWSNLASVLNLDSADPRFLTNRDRVAHADVLQPLLVERFTAQPVAHWITALREAGVPAGEIRTLDQVYESPVIDDLDLVIDVQHASLGPIKLPGLPWTFSEHDAVSHRPPPILGEHSESVRAWLAEEAP